MKTALLAAGLALAAAAPAAAQDATISAAQGQVFIRPFGQKTYQKAKQGDSLIFGDGVKTDAEGIAHIVFESGGAILLQANSEMTLTGSSDDALMNISLGEFLVGLTRKLSKGQSFRVKLPAAVAAVRGTLFWGKSDAAKKATFAGFGSKVTVTAQGRSVTIGPGEITTVTFGETPAPAKPHEIPLGYLQTFAVGGGIQDLESLVDPKLQKK